MSLSDVPAPALGIPALAQESSSGQSVSAGLPAQVPLTDAQMEKWLACQYGDEANVAFNESLLLMLEGPLNRPALERALEMLSVRHESFALSFSPDGAGQRVAAAQALPLRPVDLTGPDADARLAAHCAMAVRRPFDLTRAPLMRAELLRLAPDRNALLIVAHHLVFDGWSAAILMDELATCYRSLAAGCEPELKPAESYRVYVQSERARRTGADMARQLDYWKRIYATLPDPLALPADRPLPADANFAADTARFKFPANLVSALRQESRRLGVTLYSLLLAAFGVLVSRISGQDDFAVGIPFAGQALTGNRNLVGDGVNTLPLRLRVNADMPFGELVRETHQSLLAVADNRDLTLNTLLRELNLPRGRGRPPLTEIIFNLNPRVPALDFPGLKHTLRECPKAALVWDLFFNLNDTGDGLSLDLHYRTALFDASTIQRWIGHYETLLGSVPAGEDTSVGALPLLNARQQELLLDWNAGKREYSRALSVTSLIDAQAARTPERIAVECDGRSLSYSDLERRADSVARLLCAQGVGRGALVGVCLPRSVEMLVAVLGVMKSGAAYVPLDPAFPTEFLRDIAERAGIRHILGLTADSPAALVARGRDLLVLSDLRPGTAPDTRLPSVCGDDLVCVLYTSGSTGQPKGVRILHRNLVNFLTSMREQPSIAAGDVLCAVTTLSFDIAGLELYLPLIVGARVLIATEEHQRDPDALVRLMRERGATVLQTTPSRLRMLVDGRRIDGVRNLKLLVGGEELPRDLAAMVLPRCRELWNMYGPTETTVWSTICRVQSLEGPVPIGKPIANTRIYVLDSLGQPMPPGVRGEIWIGGDGVADGYLSRPDLTAERFLPDPFIGDGSRMYRTGDFGSRRNGVLYFHGRVDHQIKVRGFRIEPGSIEAVAMSDPAVREAVVVAREFGANDVRLVLYVVTSLDDPALAARLREHLRAQLPPYMQPQHIERLNALPKTSNGKIDRKALPPPTDTFPGHDDRINIPGSPIEAGEIGVVSDRFRTEIENPTVAPRNRVERQLADIWESILGVQVKSVKDNFFDLGGHSLTAVHVTSEIEKIFGRKVPLTSFFRLPTVEQVATLLSKEVPTTQWSSLASIQPEGSRRPFFWIHGEASNAFLSRYLGPDQPLYGIMHQSEDGQPASYRSVEDIAAHYLREIRTVQPTGPYFLGGYCFGGLAAFEIAQQLRNQNEKVDLLVLLAPDPPPRQSSGPIARSTSRSSTGHRWFRDEISRHLQNLAPLEANERLTYVLKRIDDKIENWTQPVRKLARKAAYTVYLGLGYPLPVSLRSPYILSVYARAEREYAPRSYDGAAVLFLEESQHAFTESEWRNLINQGVEVYQCAGNHTDILYEPNGRVWAKQLRILLDAAQDKKSVASKKAAAR